MAKQQDVGSASVRRSGGSAPKTPKTPKTPNTCAPDTPANTSISLLRGLFRLPDGVLQGDDARPGDPLPGQLELDAQGGRRQQRDALAQEHRDDGDVHRVHEPRLGEAAEKLAAAEEPDVL